jgi:hypothetical protein
MAMTAIRNELSPTAYINQNSGFIPNPLQKIIAGMSAKVLNPPKAFEFVRSALVIRCVFIAILPLLNFHCKG